VTIYSLFIINQYLEILKNGQMALQIFFFVQLTELRAGTIGRISLETPVMMEQELVELAGIREEKAAKKKARKQKWKGSD